MNELRFVVLRHRVGSKLQRTDQTHLDWMFQSGESLRTWASPEIRSLDHSFETDCELLVNHRSEYLDYEGDISGDRGHVTRWIWGTYQVIDQTSHQFSVELSWQDTSPRCAVVSFYLTVEDRPLRVEENRRDWRMRFSLGR